MSESGPNWSASQRIAFPFIQRGVSEGLTATEALSQYRSGGGAIRDSSWYNLYRETFSQTGVRETIAEIPITYTIPENMFQSVDWDIRQTYVLQMEVRGYSEDLGTTIRKWITVESDKLLTKAEWRQLGQEAVYDTIGSPQFEISSFLSYNPVMRR